MGVPQFFHWLVTHYEKQLLFDSYQSEKPPEYLYLDFNCAIHPAVKKEGLDTLEDMYDAVCQYLENIIKQVKPEKMVYIAIDGVAPMAKMKQQRVRRFKAVQDRRELDRIDTKFKCYEPSKFDFNMISPGTQFMEELSAKLQWFIREKLEKKWKGLKIILDDASHPGEGEHKIMAHIRTQIPEKSSVIVYGLDSDLIFLCLLHSRPGFALFRERIFFDGRKRGEDDDEDPMSKFTYLDVENFKKIILSIMTPALSKDELDSWGILKPSKDRTHDEINIATVDVDHLGGSNDDEVVELVEKPERNTDEKVKEHDLVKFRTDLGLDAETQQRLILDYVALCFVLGNDFLSHIPSLKIKEGGLNRAIECYKEVQEEMKGDYLISANGHDFRTRFLIRWLDRISVYEERDLLNATEQAEVRRSKFKNSFRYRNAYPYDRAKLDWEYVEDKYRDELQLGRPGWQDRYYDFYLDDQNLREEMVVNYLRGMYWTLRYYQGNPIVPDTTEKTFEQTCPNWDWKYYFRAAPAASCLRDYLKDHRTFKVDFAPSRPVQPVEQLLMILPPQSSPLLEQKYAKLMSSTDSPLIFQYPTNFQIDVQGHRFRWECYPILPPVNLKMVKRVVRVLQDNHVPKKKKVKRRKSPAKEVSDPVVEKPSAEEVTLKSRRKISLASMSEKKSLLLKKRD